MLQDLRLLHGSSSRKLDVVRSGPQSAQVEEGAHHQKAVMLFSQGTSEVRSHQRLMNASGYSLPYRGWPRRPPHQDVVVLSDPIPSHTIAGLRAPGSERDEQARSGDRRCDDRWRPNQTFAAEAGKQHEMGVLCGTTWLREDDSSSDGSRVHWRVPRACASGDTLPPPRQPWRPPSRSTSVTARFTIHATAASIAPHTVCRAPLRRPIPAPRTSRSRSLE